ncbi:putative pex19-domain-containing protein [Rosellinia necatrix]|uniref:Putative pex19-domain-containing protein n=1 Tax=Rosellinia necatrix TaxID=77044 RepID=A0A1W2TRP1_ROSNE|nr:putative pex19-domain-containing protein [Rosellinia necatrix]
MGTEETSTAGERPRQTDQASPIEPRSVTNMQPKIVIDAQDVDDAADPDEDDLDDLDDMLEEFSAVKMNPRAEAQKPAAPLPTASATVSPAPDDKALDPEDDLSGLDDFSEEEFQKQLQAGMAELMGDLEGSPDMQAQFESIFKGLGEATGSKDESAAVPGSTGRNAADLSQDASFRETIQRTMARMQESGEQATAAATAEASEDDFLAEMMKAMKDIPGGDGSEEDFSKLLMGMMEQLTNKEILYEPMKELNDKFPGWMAKNKDTLPKDELERYQEQQLLVAEMVSKFEEPTYSDSKAADREYIVDRMQKMQAAGSPPHDLVGDMASAKEVLDAPEESCAPQ